jgi:hypothetical protein
MIDGPAAKAGAENAKAATRAAKIEKRSVSVRGREALAVT